MNVRAFRVSIRWVPVLALACLLTAPASAAEKPKQKQQQAKPRPAVVKPVQQPGSADEMYVPTVFRVTGGKIKVFELLVRV